MFTRHISRQLVAHLDGRLEPAAARRVEIHLQGCDLCRAECEQIRRGMAMTAQLPRIEAPEAIWLSIEAALRDGGAHQTKRIPWPGWALAACAALALAIVGVANWRVAYVRPTQWAVVWLEGRGADRIAAGEWIETDGKSRARVEVGSIGSLEVAPNTRIRVTTTRPDEHRLALVRGEIRAKISAPPKLFFVDTASGTAVDLGCEYTLTSDAKGVGTLRVTTGWVSFAHKNTGRDLESLVPAGASCATLGPGIPVFDDASGALHRAVASFGDGKNGNESLGAILSESRARDTLTLWHLLSRVDPPDRERVFDRMAALTPVPAGVSREAAVRLDPPTLRRWREELAWTW